MTGQLISLLDYLPVYYQACKAASPVGSGIDVFGYTFSTAPFSIVAGLSVTASKRFRPQLWLAWCFTILGMGLMSLLTEDSSLAMSIGFQIILGAGVGTSLSIAYFPVLAPLPVESSAYALAFFIFLRNLFLVRCHPFLDLFAWILTRHSRYGVSQWAVLCSRTS